MSGSSDGEDQAGVSTSPAASISSSFTDKHTTTATATTAATAGVGENGSAPECSTVTM